MQALVAYLRENVPLCREIDIQAGEVNAHWLELGAPLEPNLNDKLTAFGGSLATICTLSGWCVTSMLCRTIDQKIDIAVIDSHIQYQLPVRSNPFFARADFPEPARQQDFLQSLKKHSRAKISIRAQVFQGEQIAVRFEGQYYARLITKSITT